MSPKAGVMDSSKFLGWQGRELKLEPPDTAIDRVTMDPETQWTRRQPLFVLNLSDGELRHSLFETNMIRHSKTRSRLHECILFGSHHFLATVDSSDHLSLHDTEPVSAEWRVDLHLSWRPPPEVRIPFIEMSERRLACSTTHLDADDLETVPYSVFFGSPVEPDNFGMWLLMGLPSAYDFSHGNHAERYLCWLQHPWQRDMLAFMGIQNDLIIKQKPWRIYHCREVVRHQYSRVDVIPTPSDQQIFQEIRERCSKDCGDGPERIFISRRRFTKQVRYRALLNEQQLIDRLEQRGFVIVEPEEMEFAQQVRLFSSARIIVGLGGAGLFNAIFCGPNTTVVSIESSPAFSRGHANLFAASGLDFGFVFGRPDPTDSEPIHKRWTLNVPEALRYIDAVL
jgi:hypothetical protein